MLGHTAPVVDKSVGSSCWEPDKAITLQTNSDNYFRWYLNGTTMQVEWANPSLLQVYNNDTTFSDSSAVIELSKADEWAYYHPNFGARFPHPTHCTGNLFVIGQGSGAYDANATTLNLSNPPRRDTAMFA